MKSMKKSEIMKIKDTRKSGLKQKTKEEDKK